MLSKEENELLTRVGPGTPMGELMRQYWTPALLSTELPSPDGPPVRVKLLGEELVAFRDTNGQVGLIGNHCPHRGASLFFGRNEECGIRCVYHGWKFDVTGQCVDMPNEPAESNFKTKIKATAYPAREWASLIWVYMGPQDRMPELPQIEWALLPESHRAASKWIQETNYMQGYEGDIDSSHSSFLHSFLDPNATINMTINANQKAMDRSPKILVEETEYGFRYGAKRAVGENTYNWRITQAMLPTYSLIPFLRYPAGGRAWIPVDDEHTMTFHITYHPERPLTEEELAGRKTGRAFPPELIPGTFTPVRNKANEYLIDRELQRTYNFTGIYGVNDQDRAIQESMCPNQERTTENIGTADLAIIAARRGLLKAARDLQQGIEPYAAHHPEVYRVRAMDVNCSLEELDAVVETYGSGLRAHA